MEDLLRDIHSTVVYLDDILITGKTEEEHLQNIDEVMTRLEEEGLTLTKEKCHSCKTRLSTQYHYTACLRKWHSGDGAQLRVGFSTW